MLYWNINYKTIFYTSRSIKLLDNNTLMKKILWIKIIEWCLNKYLVNKFYKKYWNNIRIILSNTLLEQRKNKYYSF